MKKLVAGIGVIVASFIMVYLFFSVGQYVSEDHLKEGYVNTVWYDDGGTYESTIDFGVVSFTRHHNSRPTYVVEVVNGDKSDFWDITKEQADRLVKGQYITKTANLKRGEPWK